MDSDDFKTDFEKTADCHKAVLIDAAHPPWPGRRCDLDQPVQPLPVSER